MQPAVAPHLTISCYASWSHVAGGQGEGEETMHPILLDPWEELRLPPTVALGVAPGNRPF